MMIVHSLLLYLDPSHHNSLSLSSYVFSSLSYSISLKSSPVYTLITILPLPKSSNLGQPSCPSLQYHSYSNSLSHNPISPFLHSVTQLLVTHYGFNIFQDLLMLPYIVFIHNVQLFPNLLIAFMNSFLWFPASFIYFFLCFPPQTLENYLITQCFIETALLKPFQVYDSSIYPFPTIHRN